jgi:8-oxo-dGTP pyrophosphatase MutT (NUDIX family)
MNRTNLPDELAARLARPLPGRAARRPFSTELAYGRHDGPPSPRARAASVLVLLVPHNQQWMIPLTVRPDHMTEHAGQVSFPGGTMEQGESPEQCALREYEEELGALTRPPRVLGRLSDVYVFASNFVVTPVVATTTTLPSFAPNPQEVAEVVQLPVSHLLDRGNLTHITIRRPGISFRAPAIQLQRHMIWGATCLMLGELSALLATCHPSNGKGE